MDYVVSYSGGLGSFAAACAVIDKVPTLVFTDTKTEDEDLYRFLKQSASALRLELEVIADGRNIWEVFTDERFMGNSRIDPCSKILKRELFRAYMEKNYKPEKTVIVFGIDHTEAHRMKAISERWAPWKTKFPLCEKETTREDILDTLEKLGVLPPRLYEMGFPHNNCGGFCIKTGQRQMKMLLEKLPERYAYHEREQEKLFATLGKRHGFIRKTVDGELKYMGLKEFRESLENGETPELFNEAGCGCFT